MKAPNDSPQPIMPMDAARRFPSGRKTKTTLTTAARTPEIPRTKCLSRRRASQATAGTVIMAVTTWAMRTTPTALRSSPLAAVMKKTSIAEAVPKPRPNNRSMAAIRNTALRPTTAR
ncbi:hypothetical protein D3C87_1724390 [compost metagenome]